MGITGALRRAIARAALRYDRAVIRLKSRFGSFRPLDLYVFRGHGSPRLLRVTGRLVEETATRNPPEGAGLIANIKTTVRRLESDEIPDARLRVSACGVIAETVTDHEGYFSVDLHPDSPVEPGWHEVTAEVLSSPANEPGVHGSSELLVPADDCEFGVISDLDDTVIDTGARNKATQVRQLLSRNANTHVPFTGIADLYRLLERGPDGRGSNPIFYVSKSAWNLYDLFVEFLDDHDMPLGPMFLQDAAIIEPKSPAVGAHHHKSDAIDEILELHPEMRFVLIGDSGQSDPETFLELVRKSPDRYRAVYLRDVVGEERDREVRDILEKIEALGVPAAAADTSADVARHAEEIGLVPPGSAASVAEHADRDED